MSWDGPLVVATTSQKSVSGWHRYTITLRSILGTADQAQPQRGQHTGFGHLNASASVAHTTFKEPSLQRWL